MDAINIFLGFLKVLQLLLMLMLHYILSLIAVFKPRPRKSVIGEVILVTGAGHGIGREIALEFGKLGATVVLWDINQANNEQTAADIKENGGKAFSYICDVRSSSEIHKIATKVRVEVGEVTILVNNAGILNGGSLLEMDEDDIRRTFEINTLAHFWTIREFLPSMQQKGKGHILNTISMAAFSGTAYLTDYSSSKSAALGLAESLLEELRREGYKDIKLTNLCPMFVDTGLVKSPADNLSKLLTSKEVALAGIDGMLRDKEIVTVPSYMFYIVRLGMLFPRRFAQHLKRTIGAKIDPQYRKKK